MVIFISFYAGDIVIISEWKIQDTLAIVEGKRVSAHLIFMLSPVFNRFAF